MTATLDLSSLARFSVQGLRDCLADRVARRRRIADEFGRHSVQYSYAVGSVQRVIGELVHRGVSA